MHLNSLGRKLKRVSLFKQSGGGCPSLGEEVEIKSQWLEVKLADGRSIWRDENGRYRDERGRWVKNSETPDKDMTEAPRLLLEGGSEPVTVAAQQAARQHLLKAVQELGYSARDAADAWGRLVGVQAEIAMDGQGGTRATTAAKLVAQATGMLDEEEGQTMDGLKLDIGAEAAGHLLELLAEIRDERGEGE